ncbi:MAG: hypothetical protein IH830_03745 [Planctomycetes bacterium]|nr:hypothetical protein [Planctomycetota bacterium]
MLCTKHLVCLLTLFFTCTLISSVASAQFIVHVDGDSGLAFPNPPDPGDSWDNAYKFPQDALTRAQEILGQNPPGTTVQLWVAATDENNPYLPDQGDGHMPGDRTATFNLINNVELYGGFFGNETALSQRNPEANETVLSGDINPLQPVDPPPACADPDPGAGNCFTPTPGIPGCTDPACCEEVCAFAAYCCDIDIGWDTNCTNLANGLCAMNAYHVVSAGSPVGPGVDETARLDGFTITGGHANGAGNDGLGGGMLAQLSQPVLIRCKFQGNVASKGGAVYNQADCALFCDVGLQLINCSFIDNLATSIPTGGGAIFNHSANRSLLVNCLFVGIFGTVTYLHPC